MLVLGYLILTFKSLISELKPVYKAFINLVNISVQEE